jgi:hypothetical protein
MRHFLKITTSILVGISLTSCATAPRGPAGRLAEAGIKATASFSSDTSALSAHIATGGVTEAFVERWQLCKAQPTFCNEQLETDPNFQLRQDLAAAVLLRAKALTALNSAYAALKQEAEYDAKADMNGAVNEAVAGVNSFAGVVFRLAEAPIPVDISALIGLAGGMFGDQRQRQRILGANAKLREITQRLHDALAAEEKVFGRIADPIEMRRTEAIAALFDEGLVDGAELIQPMTDSLGVKLVAGSSAKIAASPTLKAATTDLIRAKSQVETGRVRARYRASLAALQALVVEHDNLAAKRSVSLAEVVRLLDEVNAALGTKPDATSTPTK